MSKHHFGTSPSRFTGIIVIPLDILLEGFPISCVTEPQEAGRAGTYGCGHFCADGEESW